MPVLLAELDIGPYEERPSSSFPGFVERLTAWLPGLQAHTCSVGRPGGFIERLHRLGEGDRFDLAGRRPILEGREE